MTNHPAERTFIPSHASTLEALRYGAYVCLRIPASYRDPVAAAAVGALAARLGLTNEFHADAGHPPDAVAYLRRVNATGGQLADQGLLEADAVVHVASGSAAPVDAFCEELAHLLEDGVQLRTLGGVVRPTRYTSNALHAFAYAPQLQQGPASAMPNAFLVPTSKTPGWWKKDWMERHTYFLPRYDDAGRMLHEGHALAAEAGIRTLLRRTYRSEIEPAPAGGYDFVNYFECSDAELPTFHAVCNALRDVERNPEWRFVREGPTWHGRRVASWEALFA